MDRQSGVLFIYMIFPPDQIHISLGKIDHIMLTVGRTQPVAYSPMRYVVADDCNGLAKSQ